MFFFNVIDLFFCLVVVIFLKLVMVVREVGKKNVEDWNLIGRFGIGKGLMNMWKMFYCK